MSKLEFVINEENSDVMIILTPVKGTPLPNINELKQLYKNSAYKKYYFHEKELESSYELYTLESADKNQAQLKKFSCLIAHAIDATLDISFGENAMSAVVELTPAQGGQNISMPKLAQFLIDQDLKQGIYQAAMESLIQQGTDARDVDKITVNIAKGRNAINGNNAYIDYLVPDPFDLVLRPKKLANGKVDMRELGKLCFVNIGTPIAKLILPTKGTDGFTVKGEVLEAQAGEMCAFECGENTLFLDEKQTIIISAINGMPKHQENGISVSIVYNCENVDVSTGNITFDGSIIINGNVCECMKVIASKDVLITGIVESAMVKAGGDIGIAQSIIGHQIEGVLDGFDNSTQVIAGGNINAKFVQYSNLRAKGNITIEQYIAHSQVTLAGNLWVGKESKADGKLFSCYVQAGKSVKAGVLGSISGSITSIDFNHLLDAMEDYKQKVKNKTISKLEQTQKISQLIDDIENQLIDRADLLQKLHLALSKNFPLLGQLNRLYYDKEDLFESHRDEIELIATNIIYPGTEVAIIDGMSTFKREHSPSKITYHSNKIHVDPIVNPSSP